MMRTLLHSLLILYGLGIVLGYSSPERIPTFHHFDFSTHPNVANKEYPYVKRCQEKYRFATLDHFTWAPNGGFVKFPQRYFICDEFWKNTTEEKGPIFFYLGNEAAVEKYIEATGLMWELAPEFGAKLVFIEHRYYGKSKPYGHDFRQHLEYLSAEQAIADYVDFLFELQFALGDHHLPVIGFGGSYGGMLGAWMRMKYPYALHGVIASSAPIWSFMGEQPPANPNYFDQLKTYSAYKQSDGGACEINIKKTWSTLHKLVHQEGFSRIKKALKICPETFLFMTIEVWKVIYWIDHAITLMAEGSYNFPSDYMTDGVAKLPAYPLRVACSHLHEEMNDIELLEGVGKFVEVFYNVTKDKECFTLKREVSEEGSEISFLWGYQYCTEMFQMFGSDGIHDMFWMDTWDPIGTKYYCKRKRGVDSRPFWATKQWGGKDISTASNIIFSNGEYDPWRGGGVQYNVSDTAVAIIISEMGHHADLMFSNNEDSEELKAVRAFEKASIEKWAEEVREGNRKLLARMAKTEEPAATTEEPPEAVPSQPSNEDAAENADLEEEKEIDGEALFRQAIDEREAAGFGSLGQDPFVVV